MADPIRLVVPEELGGARLDRALAVLFGISRAQARTILEGTVLVDGATARQRTIVAAGSIIETEPPANRLGLQPEPVDFDIVVETEAFAVIDKPPGLVVHPGAGTKEPTLAAGLLHRFPEIEGVGSPGRWGLVHRLDRETSGCLLVARTQTAYDTLAADMKERRVKRTYTALVDGVLDIPTGTVDAPIGRDPVRPTRRAVVGSGKHAVTHYVVERNYIEAGAALLEVRLETGRTHQIRVHMAAIDHPVIGDRAYGNRKTAVGSPRVFLHAASLEFADPTSGEPVLAKAPLPPDLTSVLEGLDAGPRSSDAGDLPLSP